MTKIDTAKLKKARIEMKLTQEQLAEKADMSDRYLRSLESGRSNPSALLLYNISKALDKQMEEFISMEGEEL